MKKKFIVFRRNLSTLMEVADGPPSIEEEDAADVVIARARLSEMKTKPTTLIRGKELTKTLAELERG